MTAHVKRYSTPKLASATRSPALPPAERSRSRELGLNGVHLAVLSAFGIAQPLFTELDDGSLFVYWDLAPFHILFLAVVVLIAPPAILLGLEALAGAFNRKLAAWLHLAFVAGLAAVVASQVLVDIGPPSSAAHALLALAAGVAFAAAYWKWQPIRSALSVLGPVPLLFLALFVLGSPVRELTVAGQGDPPSPPIALPGPVVFMVLDEMPGTALMAADGGIDERRFPNFARLAGDSTWFRNATSAHSFTDFAVPSVVSGTRSEGDSFPTAADHPHNIFALLAGNPMNVHELYTDLCPRYLCPSRGSARDALEVGARTSVRQWLPESLANRVSPPAVESNPGAEAEAFVASIHEQDRPGLNFLHLLLPHSPLVYLPSGRRHSVGTSGLLGLRGENRWGPEPWPVRQSEQAYLLQLMYTDRILGAVLDRLEENGMYDSATIAVVADHGVSFHAGGSRREVTPDNFEDILSVPFFLKRPGETRGRVSDEFVRNIDVVPTLVDVLGLRSPWKFDGRSAFEPRRNPDPVLDMRTEAGRLVHFQASDFVRRRDAALRLQSARFGSGEEGLYRIGPNPELVGRAAGGAPAGSGATIDLVTDPKPVYDPDESVAPARVAGTIEGPDAVRVHKLAVALNGRIVTTTRAVEVQGLTTFSALLPEGRLRPGENEIAVYEITVGGRLARLRPAG